MNKSDDTLRIAVPSKGRLMESSIGILKKSDLLLAYNQKILKLNVTQRS